jgi:hypothetical protein
MYKDRNLQDGIGI